MTGGVGAALPALTAEIAYWTDVPEQVGFSLYPADGSSRSFAVLDLSETHRWAVAAAALAPAPAAEPDDSARYGTRRIELVGSIFMAPRSARPCSSRSATPCAF